MLDRLRDDETFARETVAEAAAGRQGGSATAARLGVSLPGLEAALAVHGLKLVSTAVNPTLARLREERAYAEEVVAGAVERGVGILRVAKELGVSDDPLRAALRAHGLAIPKQARTNPFHPVLTPLWSDADAAARVVADAEAAGRGMAATAQHLGIAAASLRRVLDHHALTIAPSRTPPAHPSLTALRSSREACVEAVLDAIERGRTKAEQASACGVSIGPFTAALKEWDVPWVPKTRAPGLSDEESRQQRRALWNMEAEPDAFGAALSHALSEGLTQAAFANELGISVEALRRLLSRRGLAWTPVPRKPRYWDAAWLRAELRRGQTVRLIAAACGVTPSAVHQAAKRSGVRIAVEQAQAPSPQVQAEQMLGDAVAVKARLRAAASQGRGIAEAAQELQMSVAVLRALMKLLSTSWSALSDESGGTLGGGEARQAERKARRVLPDRRSVLRRLTRDQFMKRLESAYEAGLTQKQLAHREGVSVSTLQDALRDHGIAWRSVAERRREARPWLTVDGYTELVHMAGRNGWTQGELAEHLGIARSTLGVMAWTHGVSWVGSPWHDAEEARRRLELGTAAGWTQAELGDHFGVSRAAIQNACRRWDFRYGRPRPWRPFTSHPDFLAEQVDRAEQARWAFEDLARLTSREVV